MNEEIKNEAISRLEELSDELGLNPKVASYFAEGKLYYSYLTAGGLIGSIDTINYDKRYADAVKEIEMLTGLSVYHVIETKINNNILLSMLYVSNHKEDWETQRLQDNYIFAIVCSPDFPHDYEIGTIAMSSRQGALIRIG